MMFVMTPLSVVLSISVASFTYSTLSGGREEGREG
jgi:hypothetical protein